MTVENTLIIDNAYQQGYDGSHGIFRLSDGTLGVLYYGAADDKIYIIYSSNNGATWGSAEDVSSVVPSSGGGIILNDSSGNLYSLKSNNDDKKLYVYVKSGGSWGAGQAVTGAEDINPAYFNACIDSSDCLHIIYSGYAATWVKYVHNVGGWQSPVTIYTSVRTCNIPAGGMTIDSDGDIYATFSEGGTGVAQLLYIETVSGVWQSAVLLNAAISHSDICCDSSGNIHVAYRNVVAADKTLYTIKRTGASWGSAVQMTDASGTLRPSLGIDDAGVIYLVGDKTDDLYYWTNNGTWSSATALASDDYQEAACFLYSSYPASNQLTSGTYVIYTKLWDTYWIEFYSIAGLPVITTVAASSVASNSAILNGTATGTFTEFNFHFGQRSGDYDYTVGAIGTSSPFSKSIGGLNPSMKYYFIAGGLSGGTDYHGSELNFTTSALSALTEKFGYLWVAGAKTYITSDT